MLVDSHCHLNMLDLTKYNGDLNLAIQAAKDNGVERMLCICVDLIHFPQIISIAEQYDNVQATVGVHPNESLPQEPSAEELVKLAENPLVIGIGETGLDYYRSEGDIEWQRERFRTHIRAAKKINKPIIVHTRQASADTIEILKEEGAEQVGGVMHCFTETYEVAAQAMDLGFYISFSGIISFANARELREVAKKAPLDRMLIETDSPYLAPVPFRGKPNEPAYVRYVAEHIANLKNVQFETVAEYTTRNFYQLFNR